MVANFSEEYLRLLVAISEVAIVAFTDKRGRITFANKKFCLISGYSFEELINQDHRMLNSGHHDKSFFREMYQTIHSGNVWRGEVQNRRKDGTYYWVDTQIIPIIGEDNKIESFASVRFDITERKKMENAMIQMEKMASLGEMSAVVAHEINNPLAIIQLSVKSVKKELRKANCNLEYLDNKIEKVMTSINRISKMLRGLKTFSRSSDKEELAQIHLKTFVEEVLSFTKCKCLNDGILLKVEEIPDIEIECRPDQLSQVIVNLLNNAYDAVLGLDEKWIEFQVEADFSKNELVCSVKDSGRGIPQSVADKMLNPFFTTKEVGKGTGLGLSISKAIIEEHNGILYLDSKGPNTLFVFRIPIIHPEGHIQAS